MMPGLVSTFIWLSISTSYRYLVFIFCSYSLPTWFLLVATRFFSVPVRYILYYVRNSDGSLQSFSLNQQLKKTKGNNTEQKNPCHKNIIILTLTLTFYF